MSDIEELKNSLKNLQEKRIEETNIKRLKKQIKAEKFAQTKGGKVFNAIGDFGLRVGKKIMTPPKSTRKRKVPKKDRLQEIKEVMNRMNRLPQ